MNFNNIKANIPNLVTCCNVISGTLAVVFSFNYNDTFGSLTGYQMAYLFIGLAAVCDFFDGFCARLLNSQSPLGKELDSLGDLVSFGVAPAMLMLNTVVALHGADWLCYVPLLIVPFGALRLAKFNTDTRQTTYFLGLPIPANAIFWIGYTAWMHRYGFPSATSLVVLVVIYSLLMVSEVKMFSLKFKDWSLSGNLHRYAIIVATLSFVACYGVAGLLWSIVFYIGISVVCNKSIH